MCFRDDLCQDTRILDMKKILDAHSDRVWEATRKINEHTKAYQFKHIKIDKQRSYLLSEVI